ncbi:12460_t:CDS:2, partial [Rhizophagus irregularis]
RPKHYQMRKPCSYNDFNYKELTTEHGYSTHFTTSATATTVLHIQYQYLSR